MKESCETDNKSMNWKEYIRSSRWIKPLVAILIGGIAGYIYYYFIGCDSGSCALTGSPVSSILTGSALGLFITNRPCSSC